MTPDWLVKALKRAFVRPDRVQDVLPWEPFDLTRRNRRARRIDTQAAWRNPYGRAWWSR